MSSPAKSFGLLAVLVLLLASLWLAWSQGRVEPATLAPAPAPAAAIAERATAEPSDVVSAAADRTAVAPEPQAEVAVPPGAVFRGRVRDSRGQPLAQVPVQLRAFDYGANRIGDRLPGVSTSDARGEFELPIAAGQAAVPEAGAGYYTLRTTPNLLLRDGAEIVLVAAPVVALRGRVRDADGMVLEGVRVQVATLFLVEFPLPLEQTLDMQRSEEAAATGTDGLFELADVPLAAGVDVVFTRAGYESARAPSMQAAAGFLEVTLAKHVAVAGRIFGIVLDAAGHAVEGAELRLGSVQQVKSAADGTFEFEYPKRPTRLLATRPGFLPVLRERVGKDTPQPLLIEFGSMALSITGRVVDPDGAPAPGMLVNLVDPVRADGQSSVERLSAPPANAQLPEGALALSDAEGRFTIAGLADRSYRVRAWDPKTAVSVQSEPVPAGSRDVELRFPPDAFLDELPGIVVDRDGRGVPKATVSVFLLASTYDGVTTVPGPLTRTDAEGHFVLRLVPRRHVHVAVNSDELVYTKVSIEDCLFERPLRIEVVRRCHVQIEGEVGFEVKFLDAAGEELWLMSQSQGRSFTTNTWQMRAAKSPVLSLPESAATMVWSRDGEEFDRKAVSLVPAVGRVTLLVTRQ